MGVLEPPAEDEARNSDAFDADLEQEDGYGRGTFAVSYVIESPDLDDDTLFRYVEESREEILDATREEIVQYAEVLEITGEVRRGSVEYVLFLVLQFLVEHGGPAATGYVATALVGRVVKRVKTILRRKGKEEGRRPAPISITVNITINLPSS